MSLLVQNTTAINLDVEMSKLDAVATSRITDNGNDEKNECLAPDDDQKSDTDESDNQPSQYVSYGPYRMDPRKGLFLKVETDGKSAEVWISGPFKIVGRCRDPHGNGWGKYISFLDKDGRLHLIIIPDRLLQGEISALCAILAEAGLSINVDKQRPLRSYLNAASPRGRVTVVQRTGWHNIGSCEMFVLPSGAIGPKGSETVILDKVAVGPYADRGSLQQWQEKIAVPAGDHLLAVLSISTALSGSLLRLAGIDGYGINLWGPSSQGKTTLLSAAASVWGRGGSPGYVRGWSATANGLEGAAASASDTLLVLDELGAVEARIAATAIYSLANGTGKQRARRDGSLREPRDWFVVTLSSGEFPIATKLTEDRGRRARAGQMVRMLDIPIDRGFGFGAFDHGGADGDAGKLSNSLKAGAVSAYGTAGPAFAQRLIDERVDAAIIRKLVADFVAANVPAGADGQVSRAAEKFGIIAAAGKLATYLGVVPWRPSIADEAAAWAFARWVEGRGGAQPFEAKQAIEAVRLVVEQHGESRFEALSGGVDARPVINRLGYKGVYGSDREYWFLPESWKTEVCAGLDSVFVARTLAERGMLRTPQSGRGLQIMVNLGGNTRARVYAVRASILDGGDDVS